jgi:hypothetical protein
MVLALDYSNSFYENDVSFDDRNQFLSGITPSSANQTRHHSCENQGAFMERNTE